MVRFQACAADFCRKRAEPAESGEMFETEDVTDRFTGERRISALIQQQDGSSPRIQFFATIAGHEYPTLAGTGHYILMIEWDDPDGIEGLGGLLGIAPEESVEDFNLFHCLIDGELAQLEGVGISKRSGEAGETLTLVISFTPEVLDLISLANRVECRAFEREFMLDGGAKGRIGELMSLTGRAKTVAQTSSELQVKVDDDLQAAEILGKVVGAVLLVGFMILMYRVLT